MVVTRADAGNEKIVWLYFGCTSTFLIPHGLLDNAPLRLLIKTSQSETRYSRDEGLLYIWQTTQKYNDIYQGLKHKKICQKIRFNALILVVQFYI